LPPAVNALGVLYVSGRGVRRDPAEAIRLFEQAHQAGLAEGTFNLSMAYQDPNLGTLDLAKSGKLLIEACEKGYVKGYSVLGLRYMQGRGVPRDGALARKWLFKAAEKGVPEGENLYGTCLLNGIGGERDGASARLWFEQSASHGNPGGLNNLGICYLNGIGVPKDPRRAADLFSQAKDQGNPDGFFNLGLCKMDGNGVDVDRDEAYRLFDQAAKRGHATAPTFVGWCLVNGWGQLNPQKGFGLLSTMAARKERAAQYYLGTCYLKGLGCQADEAKGKELIAAAAQAGFVPAKQYMQASLPKEDARPAPLEDDLAGLERQANEGNRDAMVALAGKYLEGKETAKDPRAAAVWLERATGAGSLLADYLLADLLWKGEGTDRNQPRAVKLWQQCALLGHAPSAYKLATAYRAGWQDEKPDPIAAFRWADRSAQAGYAPAMSLLATLYSLGEGTARDPQAAKEWLDKAKG
jgi:TPR repeat protein